MFNVFRLDNGTVRHFWGSELTWAATEPGSHHRSGDAGNALWGMAIPISIASDVTFILGLREPLLLAGAMKCAPVDAETAPATR